MPSAIDGRRRGRPGRRELGRQLSYIFLIAQFISRYGHDFYWSKRWQTRDNVIPFKLFYMMLNAGAHLEAADQLKHMFAHAHAKALVGGGKNKGRIRAQTRSLIRAANPEVL